MSRVMDYAPWIAAALAGAIALWVVPRRRPRRGEDEGGHSSLSADRDGDYRLLNQALAEVRRAAEQQALQMQAMRTSLSVDIDRLEGKIDEISRDRSTPWSGGWTAEARTVPSSASAGNAAPAWLEEAGRYGAESLRPSSAEPAWAPGSADTPVEIRDGVLVASRSLPPAAYAVADGGGRARVYLNPDAALNEFALPKWQAFFDLDGEKAYACYRTRRPAEVRWDDAAARGELVSRGQAESI
ncbi:MAG TPA: hypothetical protein VF665_16955 [Longimicrobium sp.]|jgi:hypothetical protein|uniref:hypothetical protein n=1 Tax=Longimicrobium sp. TaxID=2029185 RepID=UPI002ED7C452